MSQNTHALICTNPQLTTQKYIRIEEIEHIKNGKPGSEDNILAKMLMESNEIAKQELMRLFN